MIIFTLFWPGIGAPGRAGAALLKLKGLALGEFDTAGALDAPSIQSGFFGRKGTPPLAKALRVFTSSSQALSCAFKDAICRWRSELLVKG